MYDIYLKWKELKLKDHLRDNTATTPCHAGRLVGLQQARALLLRVRCADHDRLRGAQPHVHYSRLCTPTRGAA